MRKAKSLAINYLIGSEPDMERKPSVNRRRSTWHVRLVARTKEIVMARVIEFYVPKTFRKPLKSTPQPQCGKVIEFCSQTKKSA
jgi:hypothetical protein